MDVLQAIKDRRSINFFDPDRSIPDETLDELMSIANLTPSSFNLQPWEVVLVKDKERKRILRECAFNQPKVEEASVVLIIIASPGAVEDNLESVIKGMLDRGNLKPVAVENTRKMPYKMYDKKDTLSRKMFAVKNTSFFAMSVMIAAKGLGLETHPMDGINADMVKERFNIPEDRIIPLLIAVGYPSPDLKLKPRGFRRDNRDFVHIDIY